MNCDPEVEMLLITLRQYALAYLRRAQHMNASQAEELSQATVVEYWKQFVHHGKQAPRDPRAMIVYFARQQAAKFRIQLATTKRLAPEARKSLDPTDLMDSSLQRGVDQAHHASDVQDDPARVREWLLTVRPRLDADELRLALERVSTAAPATVCATRLGWPPWKGKSVLTRLLKKFKTWTRDRDST